MERFYRQLIYPQKLLNLQLDVVQNAHFDKGRYYVDNSIKLDITAEVKKIFGKLFGFLYTFGTYSAACLGLYYLIITIKIILDRITEIVALRNTFGSTWHILLACFPCLAKIYIQRENTNRITELQNEIEELRMVRIENRREETENNNNENSGTRLLDRWNEEEEFPKNEDEEFFDDEEERRF